MLIVGVKVIAVFIYLVISKTQCDNQVYISTKFCVT